MSRRPSDRDDARAAAPRLLRRASARVALTGTLTALVLVVTGGPLLPVTGAAPGAAPAAAPGVAPGAAPAVPRSAGAPVEQLRLVAADRLQPRPVPRRVAQRTAYRADTRLPAPPRVPLATWAIADLDTGEVLAAHRPRARRQPASTIKLLSALTAAERIGERARHRVSLSESQPASCVCVGLVPGRRYTRDALMKATLLVSGNDAAEALAGADPRGRAGFLRAMNRQAAALGADDTRAVNPSGLTSEGMSSTARDLLVLLRASLASPTVAPMLGRDRARFGPVRGPSRVIARSNPYVDATHGSRGKTGYTRAAGFTLVVSTVVRDADGDRRRIGAAAMGAPSREASDRAVARLTRWVADHRDELEPLGQLPPVR